MMSGLFLKILNMSILASYIVLAVLLLRLLLKKAPKWINCILWGIVGLRLVLPFSIESMFSLIPSTETISKASDSPRPYFESGISVVDNQVNGYLRGTYFEGVSRPQGNFIDITTILGNIWLVGVVALLIYTVISYIKLKKKIGTAVLLRDSIYQ
ncbi:MAG: transcriptional regulator, partial [Clostridia bacterium]|nr:transcriptional regulator [Clostridia bacterium]